MGRAIAHISASTATGILTGIARFWLEFTALLFDGYRPERHYMRGPGPAWRAKYGDPDDAKAPTRPRESRGPEPVAPRL
jgi:hypothetical protein